MNLKKMIFYLCPLVVFYSCSREVLTWVPGTVTDTGDITITCDASQGNRGLYGYKGKVYAYIGVVTDLSGNLTNWQHAPFEWGTKDPLALASPVGENKWVYSIHNIRKFFDVPGSEKILRIAILFKAGETKDTKQVLRNKDGTDMFIPVVDKTSE